jgi:wyosine [tRNA(Phe)-imidazoG37] synthetase (radical SAM superfamily)
LTKHKQDKIKYIYGPVFSWRLGFSLGIDLISAPQKICTFNCIYCQLGNRAAASKKRHRLVSTAKVLTEFKSILANFPVEKKIDYVTFSGMGEPTLAKNLGAVIKAVKSISNKPVAILTNSSFIDKNYVRRELKEADFVILKLDAPDEKLFKKVNRPGKGVAFSKILSGLKTFRKEYKGKLALQVMFVKDNKAGAGKIAELARELKPDEVQLNTPLRPCALKPLSRKEIARIKGYFKDMNVVGVYDIPYKKTPALSRKATLKRRPRIKTDL